MKHTILSYNYCENELVHFFLYQIEIRYMKLLFIIVRNLTCNSKHLMCQCLENFIRTFVVLIIDTLNKHKNVVHKIKVIYH